MLSSQRTNYDTVSFYCIMYNVYLPVRVLWTETGRALIDYKMEIH